MKRIVYIPRVVKWNISQIDYILEHPDRMGSGTREEWVNRKKCLEALLQTPNMVEEADG